MNKVSLLLAGGMDEKKAEKAIKTLQDGLKNKEIEVEVVYANTFEVTDFSQYEKSCELAVVAGVGNIDCDLPMIDGLALLYPWMESEKLYDEINVKVHGE